MYIFKLLLSKDVTCQKPDTKHCKLASKFQLNFKLFPILKQANWKKKKSDGEIEIEGNVEENISLVLIV